MTPGPPPSTPDPRKFLLAKRNPPASQDATPRPRLFQPGGAPSSQQQQQQRFQATPRFAPASSASTPRPPSGTQGSGFGFAFPGTARRRREEAIVDDGPESSPSGVRGVGDSIEVDSEEEEEEEDEDEGRGNEDENDDNDDEDEDEDGEEGQDLIPGSEGPTPKRRRVEVESQDSESGREDEGESTGGATPADHDARDEHEEQEQEREAHEDEAMPDAPETPARSEGDEFDGEEEVRDLAGTRQQQPTFRRAPRFQAPEAEAARHEGLPEAFSPQRRGARYVPGGLAAEMQSWLAEVRGWGGHERAAGAAVRFAVEAVQPGGVMYLVSGRRVQGEAEGEGPSVRLVLAGEGKLTGLARRAEVHVGAVVTISQPAWEVALARGEGEDGWVVACDWAVQTGT